MDVEGGNGSNGADVDDAADGVGVVGVVVGGLHSHDVVSDSPHVILVFQERVTPFRLVTYLRYLLIIESFD